MKINELYLTEKGLSVNTTFKEEYYPARLSFDIEYVSHDGESFGFYSDGYGTYNIPIKELCPYEIQETLQTQKKWQIDNMPTIERLREWIIEPEIPLELASDFSYNEKNIMENLILRLETFEEYIKWKLFCLQSNFNRRSKN